MSAALDADPGPFVVPAGILGEAGYILGLPGARALDDFLADLAEDRLTYDDGRADFARIRALVKRYEDLGHGLADASVVAWAERHGGAR